GYLIVATQPIIREARTACMRQTAGARPGRRPARRLSKQWFIKQWSTKQSCKQSWTSFAAIMPRPQRLDIIMALTRRLFALAALTVLLVTAAAAETTRVTFVLVNDIYQMSDQVTPDGRRRGGFARSAA